MQALAEEGCTIVMVTHELDFARNVSSHAMFLHQGRLEVEVHPRQMLVNPQSERLSLLLCGRLKYFAACLPAELDRHEPELVGTA